MGRTGRAMGRYGGMAWHGLVAWAGQGWGDGMA